jgi:hypothetical protein
MDFGESPGLIHLESALGRQIIDDHDQSHEQGSPQQPPATSWTTDRDHYFRLMETMNSPDFLNTESHDEFPSLSTSAQIAALPKRQQLGKGRTVSSSMNPDINKRDIIAEAPGISQSPSATAKTESAASGMTSRVLASSSPRAPSASTSQPSSSQTKISNLSPTSMVFEPEPARRDESCPFANLYDSAKKQLNVDSPSFTPAQLLGGTKKSTFSSQIANATPFTPKGAANGELLHATPYRSSHCLPLA